MEFPKLSPMEHALLAAFHQLYGNVGFPTPNEVRVLRRENTGAGRYVDVEAEQRIELDDGFVDLGGQYIEMEGVPNGLMAVARISGHRIHQVEIAVYGDDAWDGEERRWAIVFGGES